MQTSSHSRSGKEPQAVNISRGLPRWIPGMLSYPKLAPTYPMMKMPIPQYLEAFAAMLAKLDPKRTWEELHAMVNGGAIDGPDLEEPILCCYEKPNEFCHRRLVAEWFERELGVTVLERGYPRDAILPAASMPEKAPASQAPKEAQGYSTKKPSPPLNPQFAPGHNRFDVPAQDRNSAENDLERRIFGSQQTLL